MVYNGTTLSPRSTVHGLHLQDDQVGDIHLTLRIRGGGNLCECGDRDSSVQSPTTGKDRKTCSSCTREEASAREDAEIEALPESETEAELRSDAVVGALAEDDGDSTGRATAAAESTAPAIDPPAEVLSASQHSPTTLLPTSSSQVVDDSDAVGGAVAEADGDSTGGAAAPEAEPKEEQAEHGAGFYLCVKDPGVGVRTEPNETCERSETDGGTDHKTVREAVRLVDGTDSSGGALQYLEWKCGGYSPLVNPKDQTEVWFKYMRPLKETMVPSSAISSADRSERVCAVQSPAEWLAATQVRPPAVCDICVR